MDNIMKKNIKISKSSANDSTMITGKFNELSSKQVVQISQGLIVDNYCDSILAQPVIDFSGIDGIAGVSKNFNDGLKDGRQHARDYKETLKPLILSVLANVDNYCKLSATIPVLNPGDDKDAWLKILSAMAVQATAYSDDAAEVAQKLTLFSESISTTSQTMSSTLSTLNSIVGGDNGVLTDLANNIDDLQSKIDTAIGGIAVSFLTMIGGIFMIIVGAVTDFITAGTTTPLVIAGVAMTFTGAGGTVGSGLAIGLLHAQKASLLKEENLLKAEVKLAASIQRGITSLSTQARNAVTACNEMSNAWSLMSSDLQSLYDDLYNGMTSTDIIQELFLTTAQAEIEECAKDVSTIKAQLTGVSSVVVPAGTTIEEYMASLAA
jgi:hypothetical protein